MRNKNGSVVWRTTSSPLVPSCLKSSLTGVCEASCRNARSVGCVRSRHRPRPPDRGECVFYGQASQVSDRHDNYSKSATRKSASPSAFPLHIAVLCRQSELPTGYLVLAKQLKARVLVFGPALYRRILRQEGRSQKLPMTKCPPTSLGTSQLHKINFGSEENPKRVYELSAVMPNSRKGRSLEGVPPRFWYMLPELAPRHLPDILIPRVNNRSPKAFLNEGRRAVVDANFCTVRVSKQHPGGPLALLALLNSSWCRLRWNCRRPLWAAVREK